MYQQSIWSRFKLLLRRSTWAVIRGAGLALTVLFGVVSVGLAGLTLLPPNKPVLTLVLYILVTAVISFGAAAAATLYSADPELYARIHVLGRSTEEVLFLVADQSRRVLSRLLNEMDPNGESRRVLERFLKASKGSEEEEKRQSKEELRQHAGRIIEAHFQVDQQTRARAQTRHVKSQEKRLRRVEAMKELASAELDIPIRRLCDHVLQYSPLMHRDRSTKNLQRWKILSDPTPRNGEVLTGQAKLILQYLENSHRRMRYLEQLCQYHDLLPCLRDLTSTYSSSGSLKRYTAALAQVASKAIDGSPHEAWQRLCFLYRKQRAHPGFSLHVLLKSALAERKRRPDLAEKTAINNAIRILNDFECQEVAEQADPPRCPRTADEISSLTKVPRQLDEYQSEAQTAIAEKLIGHAKRLLPPRGNLYIVTHGFSSVVQESLIHLEAQGEWISGKKSSIFLLLNRNEDAFQSRVLEYELRARLRASFGKVREKAFTSRLAAGPRHILLALLSPQDRVLVLLGAECFDGERRVVHPRGVNLVRLTDELRQARIRYEVVVVAEHYKKCETSLPEDQRFYHQHFDRVDVYPRETIDYIVTEREILGKSTRKRRRFSEKLPH